MNGSAGICVIMAGGRGTRFWPLSRLRHPKQLLPLGESSSLLRDTYLRLTPLVGDQRILVITNSEQAAGVARELPELPSDRIIAEPVGRNTAACAVLGLELAGKLAPGLPVALLPADHRVSDPVVFRRQLADAFSLAEDGGGAVTFGIPVTRPETGYGYLEYRPTAAGDWHEGLRFIEKPDAKRAAAFRADGRHFWNSGIFVWAPGDFRAAVAEFLPDLAGRFAAAVAAHGTAVFPSRLEQAYAECPAVSIDVGLMEKLAGFKVLPAEFGWSDLGSWDAWGETAPDLGQDNRGQAQLTALDSVRNVIHAPGRTVALLGVENLVIVQTADALLIADKSRVQDIGKLTADLERRDLQDLL